MERVPLATFVNFMLSAGDPKLRVVKHWKDNRYHVGFYDFIRGAIVAQAEKAEPPTMLHSLLPSLEDERKRRIYAPLIAGYGNWWRPGFRWAKPPQTTLPIGDLEVSITPSLGFEIEAKTYIIEPVFKGFSTARAVAMMGLMTAALGPSRPGTVFGVLDVLRHRLHTLSSSQPRLGLLARGEAASFATIYGAL